MSQSFKANVARDGSNVPRNEELGVGSLSEISTERSLEHRDGKGETQEAGASGINEVRQQERDKEEEEEHQGGIPLAEITSDPPFSRREEEVVHLSATAEGEEEEVGPRLSAWATRLYTISYLIFFAIWGTLSRLGVQALTTYPGAPVLTGVLWANVGGCILMGFFIEDRNIFREEWGSRPSKNKSSPPHRHPQRRRRQRRASLTSIATTNTTASAHERWLKSHKTVKKSIPLYIGLTTGFCGSFTSFSSFMRDAFLALSNDLAYPSFVSSSAGTQTVEASRAKGDSFMAVVAVLAMNVSMSIAGFYLGAHLALALDSWTPTVPFRFTRNVLDRLMILLGWGCWLGAVLMAIWPPHNSWRTDALFSIVFAPLGCLFRFYLSLLLNARIPVFPLGTFTANVLGTGILGMCYVLQHVAGIGAPATSWSVDPLQSPSRSSLFPGPDAELLAAARSILISCQVLEGVMDGFCGAATTVSTWVAEIVSIGLGAKGRRRFAWGYLYAIVSMGVALSLLVVVMGSVRWTRGFQQPYC